MLMLLLYTEPNMVDLYEINGESQWPQGGYGHSAISTAQQEQIESNFRRT